MNERFLILANELLRKNKVDILRYLPRFLAKDAEFKNTGDICSFEHEFLRLKLLEVVKEYFVICSEKGLADWEQELNIINHDNSIESRRSEIILRLSANNIISENFIKEITSKYCNYPTDIKQDTKNYSMDLIIKKDSCYDWDNLIKFIELYKPAHIGYKLYEFYDVVVDIGTYQNVLISENMEIMQSQEYEIGTIESKIDIDVILMMKEDYNVLMNERG